MTVPGDLPTLVVVTGPPGAGKTTLARALADELGLPLVAKDDIKETLFDALGTGDRAWSRLLGAAAFDLLFDVLAELLGAGCTVVAEGNFSQPDGFRVLPPARVVQLHCSTRPETLLERYASRTDRHPGHLDVELLSELAERVEADWPPLDVPGELIELDTSASVDVQAVADRIRQAGPAWR